MIRISKTVPLLDGFRVPLVVRVLVYVYVYVYMYRLSGTTVVDGVSKRYIRSSGNKSLSASLVLFWNSVAINR